MHEYLRSRASTCLSLSSTSSVTSQIRDITAIEILVLTSWISHPRIFILKMKSLSYQNTHYPSIKIHELLSLPACNVFSFLFQSEGQILKVFEMQNKWLSSLHFGKWQEIKIFMQKAYSHTFAKSPLD